MFYISRFIVFVFLLTVYLFRSTEHDHVKDNLSAKLVRIRTIEKMKLEGFKDVLSIADYKMCETKMDRNPTWYPLKLDVFVKFLYDVNLVLFLELCSLCLCPFPYQFFFSVSEGDIEHGGYRGMVVPRGHSRGFEINT